MKENRITIKPADSYYGIQDFIEKTKKCTSEGLVPCTYTTDSHFEEMAKERGELSRMIKDLLKMSRYNYTVRNLTIYSTLLLHYIGGEAYLI